MLIKGEIRIIGIDDGPFEFRTKGKCILIGVIYRGANFLDGLIKTEIDIDGIDSTEKIANSINKSKFKDLRIIMLDGITFGGYNIADIKKIYEKTKLPVIVINRKKPDLEKFKSGMKTLNNLEKRLEAVENAGEFYWVRIPYRKSRICFQIYGINKKDAEEIIKKTSIHSIVPEPLRVAHLIATGTILGESVGRA